MNNRAACMDLIGGGAQCKHI